MATGLVITAVGLGDKGFRSVELRMLGPGIVIAGVCLTTIRCKVFIVKLQVQFQVEVKAQVKFRSRYIQHIHVTYV